MEQITISAVRNKGSRNVHYDVTVAPAGGRAGSSWKGNPSRLAADQTLDADLAAYLLRSVQGALAAFQLINKRKFEEIELPLDSPLPD
uniref:Uncharacterized protein n=1 Tax=uncultured prokaryote TaxID=198431 RepID=A0A0H5Q3T4_9ZZZZ|nr:hypothetical protein [uncultured prokaryote]